VSAQEIIERIRELPPVERAQVAKFVKEIPVLNPKHISIVKGTDGSPLIRCQGGVITSELVHEIESSTP
jgi:hypothetical protein